MPAAWTIPSPEEAMETAGVAIAFGLLCSLFKAPAALVLLIANCCLVFLVISVASGAPLQALWHTLVFGFVAQLSYVCAILLFVGCTQVVARRSSKSASEKPRWRSAR